mmetsp:Transcript_17905/g.28008  ORF Transcript_17905/g.28008 Transcript_17905/m.28008 type:complete len:81 (-) Transcript_17905:14-256(-)
MLLQILTDLNVEVIIIFFLIFLAIFQCLFFLLIVDRGDGGASDILGKEGIVIITDMWESLSLPLSGHFWSKIGINYLLAL